MRTPPGFPHRADRGRGYGEGFSYFFMLNDARV